MSLNSMVKIPRGADKFHFTVLYGNYSYIFVENFPQKFAPCTWIERSFGPSELFIIYKQFLSTCELYKDDLLGFLYEFRGSSEFYKIVLILLNWMERSSGPTELLNSNNIVYVPRQSTGCFYEDAGKTVSENKQFDCSGAYDILSEIGKRKREFVCRGAEVKLRLIVLQYVHMRGNITSLS